MTTQRVVFAVQGDPKGQPRPQAFVRGNHAAVYDPGTAEGWKSCIAEAWLKVRDEWTKTDKPVLAALSFYFKRPKSHFRTGKRADELKPGAPEYHTKKPDSDNLAKAVLDCLTRLGAWKDDSQVMLAVWKRYEHEAADAGVIVELVEIGAES
jgi:Holliday junction resolvase RusA-like endonuclease